MTGRAWGLSVTVDRLTARVPLRLTVSLLGPSRAVLRLPAVALSTGRHAFRWATPGCAQPPGCRLRDVAVVRPRGDTSAYSIDLLLGLNRGPWRVHPNRYGGRSGVSAAGGGVRLTGNFTETDTAQLIRIETPSRLPVVTAGAATPTGLDGNSLPARPVARSTALPRLLSSGSLVSLG